MLTYKHSPGQLPPMLAEAMALAEAGFEVESLAYVAGEATALREEHAPGYWTRRFRLRTRTFFQGRFGGRRPGRLLAAVQWATSYAEFVAKSVYHALRSRADVYEAHDLPPLLPAVVAAKLRRRPLVFRAHELWPETHAHVPFARFWHLLERLLVPLCDQVVTPDENRSRIYREELGARQEPLTVRNCPPYRAPVRSSRLRDELARRGYRCSTVVLYQGLLESGRCIEEIAEASRYFAEGVVLVVLGGGFGKWADPARVLAGHDRILVHPRVPYEQLVEYTASADVGILLYRNDCRNNFYCAPNKVFEYMMVGLPVIAPDFPGMKALVEGEELGICVDPASPQAIAAAVNRVATDPEARARMCANGLRLTAERYNWERECRPLLERHRALAAR